MSTPGGMGVTIITIYRHVIIHAQCQQVAHWHSKKYGKHGILGEPGMENRVFWGGRRREEQNKKIKRGSLLVSGGCFGSGEAEKERQEGGEGGRRHRGTERHYNNTHAGQEKSISISLTQKSGYGCNFIYLFIYFSLNVRHLPPPSFFFIRSHQTSLSSISKSRAPARSMQKIIIIFFPSSTCWRLSAWRCSCNTSRRVCVVFFVCPSFFALRVCLSLLGASFIYSSTGLTDRRLRSPDRSQKSIVTLCVPSDSVIGSQLDKHHCTSFFSSLHQVQHYYCVHQSKYISLLLLLFTSKATFVNVFNKTTAVSHKRQEPVHCFILCF